MRKHKEIGSRCSLCNWEASRFIRATVAPATHKVGEEFPVWQDWPCAFCAGESEEDHHAVIASNMAQDHTYLPAMAHNFTNYLCCEHFSNVMGKFARIECGLPV